MPSAKAVLVWGCVAGLVAVPLALSTTSPLLAWRDPVYIAAGLAGILALGLLLVQPLLAAGLLPGLRGRAGRTVHAWVGGGLLAAVVLHVGALWVTSPPDVIDALLFRSPTPFSDWGVIAMWAVIGASCLAVFRRRLRLRPALWRAFHLTLASVTVVGTVVHAVLIEGTMETFSKAVLCAVVIAALGKVLLDHRARTAVSRRKA